MERRDFLRAGLAAGGSLGLGAAGCGGALSSGAAAGPSTAELAALDMASFLERLDTTLGFMGSAGSVQRFVAGLLGVDAPAAADPILERDDLLGRKALRAMTLAGAFNDLPEAGRAHPGMQARMWNALPEIEEAVMGMRERLAAMTPTERADVGRTLREDPSLGPRILGALDVKAEKAGVSDHRRARLREVGDHAVFRLKQSPSLFIDDYDDKVRKVAARDASIESIERRLMAELGEKEFWDMQARQLALVQAWQQVPGMAQSAVPGGAPTGTTMGPGPAGSAPIAPAPMGAAAATAAAATATAVAPQGTVPVAPQGTVPAAPQGTVPAAPTAIAAPPGYGVYPYGPPPPIGAPIVVHNEPPPGPALPGTKVLISGATLMGVGVTNLVTGLVLISTTSGGAAGLGIFMLTAAAVAGLAGLICLIVGAVMRSVAAPSAAKDPAAAPAPAALPAR